MSNASTGFGKNIKPINKFHFLKSHLIILCALFFVSLFVRVLFFSYNTPVTLDGMFYFRYAIDAMIQGQFPSGYEFPNNGWPSFLSILFSIAGPQEFIEYTVIQRITTMIISSFTAIPVYLLCKHFVEQKYALFGSALFVFEPRIIQNSLLGISEPLFIILASTTLFLFLSSRNKMTYVSFVVAACTTIVRYEGILLILTISILFFIKNRKWRKKKLISKYLIAVCVFMVILAPIGYIRTQTIGSDGLSGQIIDAGKGSLMLAEEEKAGIAGIFIFLSKGLIGFAKYVGVLSIPYFFILTPIGAILLIKKRNFYTVTIVISVTILSITAIYAYSRGIQETRYLFILLPLFSIMSAIGIKRIVDQHKYQNIILFCIIILTIGFSMAYTEYKLDVRHEEESFEVAQRVVNISSGVNQYYPESRYIEPAEIQHRWNELKFFLSGESKKDVSILKILKRETPAISLSEFSTLNQFIYTSKNSGLSHLVIDEKKDRPKFLSDIFYHEGNYPYLTKVFDSKETNMLYHVKIYEIAYDRIKFVNSTQ